MRLEISDGKPLTGFDGNITLHDSEGISIVYECPAIGGCRAYWTAGEVIWRTRAGGGDGAIAGEAQGLWKTGLFCFAPA